MTAAGGVAPEIGAPMHHDSRWPWRIPLRRRDGSLIAWTLLDEEDFDSASQFRWHAHYGPSIHPYAARWLPRDPGTRRIRELLHRRVLGLYAGNPLHSDHINRDTLDNRRSNLRAVTRAQNMQNQSGRGVAWVTWRKRWSVQIKVDGIVYYGGFFKDEETAVAKARELYAEHNPFKTLL